MPTKLIFALLAILLLVTLPSFAGLFTEWLWFGEVGYQAVFIKSLTTKGLLGLLAFVGTFAVLFANLRLAVRGPDRPYEVFAGAGDIQPIVLERRHLSLLAAGISGVVAVVVAGMASSQWLVTLQFLNATPFGEVDPIFGRDVAFYIFTLPFLDFARYLGLGVISLAFIGSTAAYVVTGQLALLHEAADEGKIAGFNAAHPAEPRAHRRHAPVRRGRAHDGA